jgi:hypothetical protein
MQGGAVAALLASAVESHAREAAGRDVFLASVMTHFLRPVPIALLDVDVETLKAGRRVSMFDARLRAGGETLAVQRVTAIAAAPDDALPTPPAVIDDPLRHPAQARNAPHGGAWMMDAMECRPDAAGKTWFRLLRPVVCDQGPMSAVLPAADWAHGIAAPIGARAPVRAAIPNPDLSVHLLRAPRGAWIGLEQASAWSRDAIGLGWAALHDCEGLIGRVAMSVAVTRLEDPPCAS